MLNTCTNCGLIYDTDKHRFACPHGERGQSAPGVFTSETHYAPTSDDDRLLWEAMRTVASTVDWHFILTEDARIDAVGNVGVNAMMLVAEFKKRRAKEMP